ncbi:MAG: hypothetical protein ACI8ZX_000869 [Planctomycetota bacterium]|jgi:hypothetical protein
MKKKLIVLVALGILMALVFGYTQYNKPHRNIAEEKADFSISANELFDEFDADEKKANAKYLDKVIEVTGSIIDIENNLEGNSVIMLEAENAMIGGVLCTLNPGEELKADSEVTLKCRCTGFLADVVLTECSVLK